MNHEISKISGSDIMMVTYDLRIYRIPYTVNQKNLQNLPFYNMIYPKFNSQLSGEGH